MFELKRKPNQHPSIGTGAATAVRRGPDSPSTLHKPVVPLEGSSQGSVKTSEPTVVPAPTQNGTGRMRMPVITGEAHYKGMLPIDGIVFGQLGANGGSLGIKQRSASFFASRPELSGEISFRDMLRVNGHIAGTVYSDKGTLIIDNSAIVDANIQVETAVISGTVNGDIVAHKRVELGAGAKIYGNIWTRSIAIKDGAIFDGLCTMIGDEQV